MEFYENSFIPKYKLIQSYIINEVKQGRLKHGDRIPSELELSRQFGVSRVTANAAVKELATLGIVQRVQGLGSFVQNLPNENNKEVLLFDDNTKIGIQSDVNTFKSHKVGSIRCITPDEHLCSVLNLSPSQEVIEVVRENTFDTKKGKIDVSYFAAELLSEREKDGGCPLTEEEIFFFSTHYCYEFVKSCLKITCRTINVFFHSAEDAPKRVAPFLPAHDSNYSVMEMVICDNNKKPVCINDTIFQNTHNIPVLMLEII